MSEYDTTDTFEKDFRCLLIRLVEELGAAKFSSFCFILGVPEPVCERHRADVLRHLLEQGKISSRRPHGFVRLLRNELQRDDLATRAETAISKAAHLFFVFLFIFLKSISDSEKHYGWLDYTPLIKEVVKMTRVTILHFSII